MIKRYFPNYNNSNIHRLLKIHLDALQERSAHSVLCVGSSDEVEKCRSQVKRWRRGSRVDAIVLPYNSGRLDADEHKANYDTVKSYIKDISIDEIGIVLLCGETIRSVNIQHAATIPLKRNKRIVVSCFSRPIYAAPVKNTAGATYEGIFSRVANLMEMNPRRGDYLEFGVFDGRTVTLAWQCMKDVQKTRFIGFDTFSGIKGSEPGEQEEYRDGDYFSNIETFTHNMQAANVESSRVITVQGDFRETLASPEELHRKLEIETCLVAHFDADVYEPTKKALDFLTPVLTQGSILLFDEYHAHGADNALGERRALNEWLKENQSVEVERYHDYAAAARAFIVHIKH